MEALKDSYFNWILNKLFDDKELMDSYTPLLRMLNSIEFEWSIELDENRQKDAQDLRYIFGDENGYYESEICRELDMVAPSLFEVIAALIFRVQDSMIGDFDVAVTNQEIMLDILKSLKLDELTGELSFDDLYYVEDVITTLYSRNYEYNGEGSLFTVNVPKDDMRETQMWYQMMWYLNEKLGGKYL